MYVLICSQGKDPHVDSVMKFIKEAKATPILFERYLKNNLISFVKKNNELNGYIKIKSKKYFLNSATFPCVWWRLKPMISSEIGGGKSSIKDKFRMLEWRECLSSIGDFLSESKWINPTIYNQKMGRKVFQLKLAMETNLLIPETVITNDNLEVLKLFKKNGVIYKTLSSFITETKGIYTNEIQKDMVRKNRHAIFQAPGIFQHLIKKDHELRITIIGKKIFIMKINSQINKKTSLDWRYDQNSKMFSIGSLTKETTKALLNFHQKSGLIYAAYDFIVDQTGKEIFLECNPGGQWFWEKSEMSYAISQAIANELVALI